MCVDRLEEESWYSIAWSKLEGGGGGEGGDGGGEGGGVKKRREQGGKLAQL